MEVRLAYVRETDFEIIYEALDADAPIQALHIRKSDIASEMTVYVTIECKYDD